MGKTKTHEVMKTGWVPRGEGIAVVRDEIGQVVKGHLMSKKDCVHLCKLLSGNQKPVKRTVSVTVTVEDE